MRHHPVFETFHRTKCVGTGKHVFDFLGVATNVSYKKGWARFAHESGLEISPKYPPVDEHYFDWIALLQSVRGASGTFRMAELGAGWAPWLVRAVFAAAQVPAINKIELVGVEADSTHYQWLVDHFLDNDLNPEDYHLLHGAVSPVSEILKFPKISNPDENYGASTRGVIEAAWRYRATLWRNSWGGFPARLTSCTWTFRGPNTTWFLWLWGF